MINERSIAQRARQSVKHRSNGKYAKTNPCECCGKSAGIEFYSADGFDQEGGFGGLGQVLCKKCCTRIDEQQKTPEGHAAVLAMLTANYEARQQA